MTQTPTSPNFETAGSAWPSIYDPEFVKGVFDRCSGKYIAFSYVCST